jgi:hypothetical protein
MSKISKAIAAFFGSGVGAWIVQAIHSPAATDAVTSVSVVAGSWVATTINSVIIAAIAAITTYIAPKNSPT